LKQFTPRVLKLSMLAAMAGPGFLACGCGSPSQANIDLRKQNQTLQDQIASLNRRHDADAATITGLQSKIGTVPTLPRSTLDELFTVHGLRFGSLTGGDRSDPKKPYDDSLKVYVVPIDDDGQPLKAAGAFRVEAFDLALPTNQKIGQWDFSIEQARNAWNGAMFSYGYVLDCPWQTTPTHADLTIKVQFTDPLTGRVFTEQRQATATPWPVTASDRP
jgi:hypothetical protein